MVVMSECSTCGADPCRNPSFCGACREADRRKARGAARGAHTSPDQSINGLIRTIANASEGERNHCTFWAACRFAELIQQGAISEGKAVDIIIEAAGRAGLHHDEARKMARSAFQTIGI